MMGERARLTPVDVVYIAVGLAALAFLAEPLYTALDSVELSTGATLLFQMLPPALVTMILFVTYRISLIGSGS